MLHTSLKGIHFIDLYFLLFNQMDFDFFLACWITHYCIKQLFDTEDNLYPSKHDVTFVKQTMYKHFQVRNTVFHLRLDSSTCF